MTVEAVEMDEQSAKWRDITTQQDLINDANGREGRVENLTMVLVCRYIARLTSNPSELLT